MNYQKPETHFVFIDKNVTISGSGEKPTPKPSSKRWMHSLIGYGIAWATSWKYINPSELANILNSIGANITVIEIDYRQTPEQVAKWIQPFRDLNIWVNMKLVNWNTKESQDKSEAEYKDYFNRLKTALVNTHMIILDAGTEPGNRGGDKGKIERCMKWAYENWPGVKVLSIRDGWWAQNLKTDFKEEHWCSIKSKMKTGAWITTTDCSPLINASPDQVYKLTKMACQSKANFIMYHADWSELKEGKRLSIDYGKLDSMKRAIEESQ